MRADAGGGRVPLQLITQNAHQATGEGLGRAGGSAEL